MICLVKKVPPEMNQLLIYTLDTVRSQNTEWAVQAAASVGKTSSLCARPSSNLPASLTSLHLAFHPPISLPHRPKPLPPSAHWWHLVAQLLMGHGPSPWECTQTSRDNQTLPHTSRFSLYFTQLTLIAGPFPAGASCGAFEAAGARAQAELWAGCGLAAQNHPAALLKTSLPVLQASSFPGRKVIRESP